MSIGDRIRFFRKIKGITQRELGLKLGYNEKTADVRVAQYESNRKIPRQETLVSIANILDVSVLALTAPSIDSMESLMHTLFLLEDEYGFQISMTDDGSNFILKIPQNTTRYSELPTAIETWYYLSHDLHEGDISKEAYDTWRYHYPDIDVNTMAISLKNGITFSAMKWMFRCTCIESPAVGSFHVNCQYTGIWLSERNPQEYQGHTVTEGFLLTDEHCKLILISSHDFPNHFIMK